MKVQLNARVPERVRALAQDAAKRAGESLNLWVERVIVAAANTTQPHQPSLDDARRAEKHGEAKQLLEQADRFVAPRSPVVARSLQPFAANCKSGTLHFRHGPGHPCKFCGGEV